MSDKSVVQKLGIKKGQRLVVLNAPEGYQALWSDLPEGASLESELGGTADVVQCFAASRVQLEDLLPKIKGAIDKKGIVWVAYPKGTSKTKSDINRDSIRAYAQSIGMETVALFAIDDVWSSIRLKIV